MLGQAGRAGEGPKADAAEGSSGASPLGSREPTRAESAERCVRSRLLGRIAARRSSWLLSGRVGLRVAGVLEGTRGGWERLGEDPAVFLSAARGWERWTQRKGGSGREARGRGCGGGSAVLRRNGRSFGEVARARVGQRGAELARGGSKALAGARGARGSAPSPRSRADGASRAHHCK